MYALRSVLFDSHLARPLQISTTVNGNMGGSGGVPALPRARSNALALVEERLSKMHAEGLDVTAWDTLHAACAYCRSIGDKVGATSWASRAAENARMALGRDSEEFQKYAALIGSRRGAAKA